MTIDGATKLFPGITYGVSDTSDGNMSFTWGPTEEVIRNREVFLRGKGLKLEDCAVMSLQHEEKSLLIRMTQRSLLGFIPITVLYAPANPKAVSRLSSA